MSQSIGDIANVRTLDELYPKLGRIQFGAGWNKTTPSLWNEPRKVFQPHVWRYDAAKAALDAAGRLISTDLAERRNLILVNPCEGNTYATSNTIVSAYQMIMPGEVARSHRHVPNALRLILDTAPGAFTIVDDEKLPMSPGDVVLTPNWCWHGHGNESNACGYWIDFLDVPLVQLLGPMFFEPRHDEPAVRPTSQSPLLFPWKDVERRLADAPADPTGRAAAELRLDTPTLDTFRLSMQRLEPNQNNAGLRTTANSIYAVAKGRGRTVIDDKTVDWTRGDVFVAPAWYGHRHQAAEPSVLFRVTDEEAMARLGFLREEIL